MTKTEIIEIIDHLADTIRETEDWQSIQFEPEEKEILVFLLEEAKRRIL